MIKHVVCFKLKDNSEVVCEKTKDVLLSMKTNVKYVKDIEVGIDFLHSPRSYDIHLTVLLENKEALDLYQDDPYHADVVKQYMNGVSETSITVDYEM